MLLALIPLISPSKWSSFSAKSVELPNIMISFSKKSPGKSKLFKEVTCLIPALFMASIISFVTGILLLVLPVVSELNAK